MTFYEQWISWRNNYHQANPVQEGHFRLDIELAYPRATLLSVPIEYNPHKYNCCGPHDCYYVCADWSTIEEVRSVDGHHTNGIALRMLVESGHSEPIGERIKLLSTSSSIFHPPWQDNTVNDFAFFRGRYWRVTWNEHLGEFPAGYGRLPVQDRSYYDLLDENGIPVRRFNDGPW